MNKTIFDQVHGEISNLPAAAYDIIESKQFCRLKNVQQLGEYNKILSADDRTIMNQLKLDTFPP
jgi:HD superfamily phosphohydrolase